METTAQSYYPRQGVISLDVKIGLPALYPLCSGPGDTILVKKSRPDLFPDSRKHQVCAFDLVKDSLSDLGVSKLSDPPYWCDTLQYIPATGHYLFAGTKNRESGVIEFDSEWKEVRRLMSAELFPLEKKRIIGAFLLSSGKLIIRAENDLYVTSWSMIDTYWLQEGWLLDVSNDGKFVVFKVIEMESTEIHEFDSETEKTQLIEKTSDVILHARYSPDGRWIAYSKNLEWAFDTPMLFLYKRQEKDIVNCWVLNKWEFLWTKN